MGGDNVLLMKDKNFIKDCLYIKMSTKLCFCVLVPSEKGEW
jgi:hypothetical protein